MRGAGPGRGGRHRGGVAAFRPRPDPTSGSSGGRLAASVGSWDPPPAPASHPSRVRCGAGEGRTLHSRSSCPCAPALALGCPGSPPVQAAAGSRPERSWGGGGGPAGLSPPRGVASYCWSQGHSRTAGSPPRDRRTRAAGLGHRGGRGVSARAGQAPVLSSTARPGPRSPVLPGPAAQGSPTGSPRPWGAGGERCHGQWGRVRLRRPPPERGSADDAEARSPAGGRRAGADGRGLTRRGCRRCKSPTC